MKYLIFNIFLFSLLSILTDLGFALGDQEQEIYEAYKVVKMARKENRNNLKEELAHNAFLVEKNIVDNGIPQGIDQFGGTEVIALTKDTGKIISGFLNDGMFLKGKEVIHEKESSPEAKKVAERFLNTALDFNLALANQLEDGGSTCQQQYFNTSFDPTNLNPDSAIVLDNLPMDPKFLRRLSLSVPKDGIAEYFFHNGQGDVVKISFIKNKPQFQLYTMMTFDEKEVAKKIGSNHSVNIDGLSLTIGSQHTVAEKTLGKTDLSLRADTAITSQINGPTDDKSLTTTISGASAEASLLAEKGNKTLLFTGGIKAICRNNSNCDDITDYRHIQLGSMRFDNPTWSLDGKISTDSNVLTAEVKRGDFKGSKAVIDKDGEIDLTGKYHAYVFEQEVRYYVHANRNKAGENTLDISIEDSKNNRYGFNSNKEITRLSMQNTIIKTRQTTCTGTYELFERHTARDTERIYDRGNIINEGYYDPHFGSDSFDAKGAGVAVTINCQS